MQEITEQRSNGANTDDDKHMIDSRDTLYVAGGLALLVLGTGLIMTNRDLRKIAIAGLTRLMPDLEKPLHGGLAQMIPDFERYMKLRSM